MSRFWNAQSRIRLACVDDGQEKAAHPQAQPDRRPRLAPRPPQGRAPPPPRGHHRARNPRRPLPAPRRRTLHPRRRPCPLHLRRLSRLPHGLQSRHRTPPHPRRLRAHHLQHGPLPRRPGHRPRRGLHLLRHHLLLEEGRSRALRSRHRARPHPWRAGVRHHRLLAHRPPPPLPPLRNARRPSRRTPAARPFRPDEAARVFPKAPELRHQYPSIVGIGIGGDEARGPASLFKALYDEARANGLRLTAHAGESGGPIDGPASIWAAINIGAERIGHGLAAEFDPQLLEVLAHKQIPIEINVTSNIRTGCCPTYEEPPLRRYFDAGLMVTLNSDDPPMFGANLL